MKQKLLLYLQQNYTTTQMKAKETMTMVYTINCFLASQKSHSVTKKTNVAIETQQLYKNINSGKKTNATYVALEK